jgi:lipopolysaccharide transport system ATP-binding protein
MASPAIRVSSLGKRYRIGASRRPAAAYKTIRESLTGAVPAAFARLSGRRARHDHVWALRDVSFDVNQGDVLGVIGRNGAGKSTLLKILSRITEPTAGWADVKGRVGSLLEVGTGFHQELTGRDNIFLSGAILGMKRSEIAAKFDRIVDFAEVETFIDTPVKHYSSGMYLRLAFGVAAHLEPDILMVDEVLAVGDLAFQRKCMGKMQEVGSTGQTVLFVSHDLTAVSRLATRSLVLQNGELSFMGSTDEALRRYSAQRPNVEQDLSTRTDRTGDGVIRLESLRVYDAAGRLTDHIASGAPATIVLTYSSQGACMRADDVALDLRLSDILGHPIATLSTRFSAQAPAGPISKSGCMVCHIPSLALAEESYAIDVWLAYRGGVADSIIRAGDLRVATGHFFATGQEPVKRKHGAALLSHVWTFEDATTDTALSSLAREARPVTVHQHA